MTTDPPHLKIDSLARLVARAIPVLLILAVMLAAWFALERILSGHSSEELAAEPAAERSLSDTLTLPKGKLRAGEFESAEVEMRAVQHRHTVPGRIRYDETKHVEVQAPMDGVIDKVLVTPGESVACGQRLAVLRSPEIGKARAEVLDQKARRDIAQRILDRELAISKNLEQLSQMLDGQEPIAAIEAAFADRSLGSYREPLMAGYARLLLATDLHEQVQPLGGSGSISGRTIRERQADRQISAAAYRTARDEAGFAAKQALAEAEAKVAEAERQLNLAWERLETLLGYKEDADAESFRDRQTLSRLEIRAPMAGTVESRSFADSERVTRGDSLFVLANTDSLYVAASLREDDWSAVTLQPGTRVTVTVPALENRILEATIDYVGREVAPESNAVPLVASISNEAGLLRPGMYVRVTVPMGASRRAVSVRSESVVQHENQSFVFLNMKGGRFKRVDVSTGLASPQWTEVTSGLSPGQLVVTRGSFLLKSELLLQGEVE